MILTSRLTYANLMKIPFTPSPLFFNITSVFRQMGSKSIIIPITILYSPTPNEKFILFSRPTDAIFHHVILTFSHFSSHFPTFFLYFSFIFYLFFYSFFIYFFTFDTIVNNYLFLRIIYLFMIFLCFFAHLPVRVIWI